MPWQDCLPSYRSVRFIEVKNWKLALVHIALQLGIILYVVVYSIVIKQSYQEYDPLVGTTVIKVKGSAQQNGTAEHGVFNGTVFDASDLVIPPVEADALFIGTNVIRTIGQTRGKCAGNDEKQENCTKCEAGVQTYNGIMTGNQSWVGPHNASGICFCELYTWCPLEYENKSDIAFMDQHQVHGVEAWSIFVRANIFFPKFNVSKTNAPTNDPIPNVNQWLLGDLVENTGWSYNEVANLGAIILVTMSYECDLNHDIDECHPDVSFQRMDPTNLGSKNPGFNYRYVDRYWDEQGLERRTLTKASGVRVLFQLIGKAGKFNVVPLLVALGSGLGLLSVATIVCDFVMQYLLPARRRYKREKIIDVPDEDIHSPRHQSQQQPHIQHISSEPLLEQAM